MKLFSIFHSDKGANTLKIGGGDYLIEIPKIYLWEYDNEGTLLFYPKGDETITIRVTVLSFDRKDGKPSHGADIVLEDAVSKNFKHEILSEGVVLSESPPKLRRWCGAHRSDAPGGRQSADEFPRRS